MKNSKNILVTGGIGFIGTHACFALLEKGYNIFVLDSLINSKVSSIEKINEFNKLLILKGLNKF